MKLGIIAILNRVVGLVLNEKRPFEKRLKVSQPSGGSHSRVGERLLRWKAWYIAGPARKLMEQNRWGVRSRGVDKDRKVIGEITEAP